jgi:2-dehydropantoate 2-reductase
MKQWEKLVINAIINPLTALSGETNGSLLTRQEEVEALCHELMPLLLREGFNLPEEAWVARVMDVATATAPNYSSMQQDLAAGRPTEIDYITGFILREAQPLGLHMPLLQQLYDAISHRSPAAAGISNFSI